MYCRLTLAFNKHTIRPGNAAFQVTRGISLMVTNNQRSCVINPKESMLFKFTGKLG